MALCFSVLIIINTQNRTNDKKAQTVIARNEAISATDIQHTKM